MKIYQEKLVDILCEVESVRNDLQITKNEEKGNICLNCTSKEKDYVYRNLLSPITCDRCGRTMSQWVKDYIISYSYEPIQYHHLMMYCKEKKINFTIEDFYLQDETKYVLNLGEEQIEIDYNKSLNNQSEKVFESIYNLLHYNK